MIRNARGSVRTPGGSGLPSLDPRHAKEDRVRPFFPAVIALVVGIVLGAWQPRGELLEARAELDAARARGADCRGNAAESIRSILRADPGGLEGRRPVVRNTAPTEEPAPEVEAPPEVAGEEPAAPPETPEQVREAMHTALDARRAQALAALIEQGDLDDAEIDAVESAMADMNRALKAEVDRFVADANETGVVERRDLMEFAAESLDIVIAADEKVRATVPAEAYEQIDDAAVDPFSYISGETLDGLTRLEDIDSPLFDR